MHLFLILKHFALEINHETYSSPIEVGPIDTGSRDFVQPMEENARFTPFDGISDKVYSNGMFKCKIFNVINEHYDGAVGRKLQMHHEPQPF